MNTKVVIVFGCWFFIIVGWLVVFRFVCLFLLWFCMMMHISKHSLCSNNFMGKYVGKLNIFKSGYFR